MAANIPQTLGGPVTTRTITWEDQVVKAWGSEYRTPDHGIYEFSNGAKKDSTDKGLTGIYGVHGDYLLMADGTPYPDMRDGIIADIGTQNGAARNGFGNFEEIDLDPRFPQSAGSVPAPILDFTVSKDGVSYVAGPISVQAGATVFFKDTTQPASAIAWAWNFGDSGVSSNQNPSHVFASVGTFTVTMSATLGSSKYQVSKTAEVVVTPSDAFASDTLLYPFDGDVLNHGGWQPAGMNMTLDPLTGAYSVNSPFGGTVKTMHMVPATAVSDAARVTVPLVTSLPLTATTSAGEWTMEYWVKFPTVPPGSNSTVVRALVGAGSDLYGDMDNTGGISNRLFRNVPDIFFSLFGPLVNNNQWGFVTFTRKGAVIKAFYGAVGATNATLYFTGPWSNTVAFALNQLIVLGANNDASMADFAISNLRITRNHNRYLTDVVPVPTAPFPTSV